MTRYSVLDGRDNILYEVRHRRTAYNLFEPGSEIASFTFKPKRWTGLEYQLIDTPVDYLMATFKERQVFDPTGNLIGDITSHPVTPVPDFKSMFDKERMRVAMVMFRQREFVMNNITAIRFDIEPKLGGINIYVLRPELRYMSKAVAISIGFRILTSGSAAGSGD